MTEDNCSICIFISQDAVKRKYILRMNYWLAPYRSLACRELAHVKIEAEIILTESRAISLYPWKFVTSLALLAPNPTPCSYTAVCLDQSKHTPTREQKHNAQIKHTHTGFTRPSPLDPSPAPSLHPIFFNSLFPTLFSSLPGKTGAGGGGAGAGGASAHFRFFSETCSGIGWSG